MELFFDDTDDDDEDDEEDEDDEDDEEEDDLDDDLDADLDALLDRLRFDLSRLSLLVDSLLSECFELPSRRSFGNL